MPVTTFDVSDIKRRMQGAIASLKHDLGSLRTGRATPSLVEPIQIEAYGATMPMAQVATVSVPEPRLLSIQVWDRSMVAAVEKAIRQSDLGLNPQTEGQVIRLRIPEMNEQRRKEMVKVAHKYAEEARVAARHVRRDGIDILKKLQKDGEISEDDEKRHAAEVQKATDATVSEIDGIVAAKEKEIMQVYGRRSRADSINACHLTRRP
ncbi:MAG: frr [Enterovirga sp.]|nr:frr [Enterovirga sp.]